MNNDNWNDLGDRPNYMTKKAEGGGFYLSDASGGGEDSAPFTRYEEAADLCDRLNSAKDNAEVYMLIHGDE
jgi:hypothetical protein